MRLALAISLSVIGTIAACAPTGGEVTMAAGPVARLGTVYEGVETRLLHHDLVQFSAAVSTVDSDEAAALVVDSYSQCAAAQYTLIRGYGFARHLRTKVYEEGGLWRADAVYTISPALPRGLKTLDAEVVAAACRENGIPMV